MKLIRNLTIFILLTIVTQVGGLIWFLSIFLSKKLSKRKRLIFPIVYLTFNLILIPPLAKVLGREPLPVFSSEVKPRNIAYPLLFRNYVNPDLKNLLLEVSNETNMTITYLDANFPFKDGFPLLPHLSHSDGKKIDLSFYYLDKNGKTTNKKPSVSGYGSFIEEHNETSRNCLEKGYWQYDYPKYLTFGVINNLQLDKTRSEQLLGALLSKSITEKIFIEPYLQTSLSLDSESKIRFHGCRAVRHDDHIHLQIK